MALEYGRVFPSETLSLLRNVPAFARAKAKVIPESDCEVGVAAR